MVALDFDFNVEKCISFEETKYQVINAMFLIGFQMLLANTKQNSTHSF